HAAAGRRRGAARDPRGSGRDHGRVVRAVARRGPRRHQPVPRGGDPASRRRRRDREADRRRAGPQALRSPMRRRGAVIILAILSLWLPRAHGAEVPSPMPPTYYRTVQVDGLTVFYRE